MKKNKKKIILSGVLLVTVGMSGIVFLQNKVSKELDKNVKEELSAYNYDANNILDNVFEENGTTILPIIYNNSYETISKEKIEQYFKNAGLNIKDISTNEIGTGTVITTDEKKYTVIVYGDVDGDGIVDTFDAQNILLHRVFGQNYVLKGIYKIAANVYNDDDEIDVFDAQKILEFRIGNEEELVLYPPVSNKEKDKEAPVITLKGENPQVIEVGSKYTELGATVTDNYDKNVTVKIDSSNVNTSKQGQYVVKYNATDASGNKAKEVTRTVKVVDTTKPVITLKGENPQVIEVGSKYTELGATVTDNYDKNVTVKIDSSNVNTSKQGQYVVKYNATDASGNKAEEVTRTVIVRKSVYITGIEIVKEPDNCDYKYGHTIDTTGLKVYANMSNGDTKDITSNVKFDITKATADKVTVKYTTTETSDATSKEFTATFDINVTNYIKGIKLVKTPDIVEYVENENISLNGIKVVAVKADGNEDEEIVVTTEQEKAVFGTNIVTVEYTTTNTEDDTSRTFKATYDINVVYPMSTVIPVAVNTTGYRYDEVDIATISSGANQKEITLNDTIECKIVKDGREINNTEAEISYSANNNSSITGQVVITLMAKSTGNYTITPKVNGIEADSSVTVTIKENPVVTSIVFDDNLEVKYGKTLSLPITFKHKYPDDTEVDVGVKASNIKVKIDGALYEFQDNDGIVINNDTKEVSKINLIPGEVEVETIKSLKIEVVNENAENCGIEREITILPEPKLQITEDTIKLYADRAKVDTDKVVIDEDESDYTIYTLVPIVLDDGTKLTKKEVDDYIRAEDNYNVIVEYYKDDKTEADDNDTIEYMGISAFDIYNISNNIIKIYYKDKLVKTINVEPVKKAISEVNVIEINRTGVRYEEFDVATISSGENEDEIVTDNSQCVLSYEITKNGVATNDMEVTYNTNNSSAIEGQVILTVKANKAGVYRLLPKVNGISPMSPIEITIKESPIVTDVKLGEYTTTDIIRLPSGEKTQLPLTFIHEYSESEKVEIDVTYNRLSAEGTNYEFLYKDGEGGISEVTSGNVNMIAITPSQIDTSIIISVNNNGNLEEFEFTIEPVLVTKSIETVSTIRFADIAQDGVSVEDSDGVVFTLVPIVLKDNLGNKTPLTKADFEESANNIIKITYNEERTEGECHIINKYYYKDSEGNIKEAQSEDAKVEYIGFATDGWTTIEELAQYPIVITYNGVATNITITE